MNDSKNKTLRAKTMKLNLLGVDRLIEATDLSSVFPQDKKYQKKAAIVVFCYIFRYSSCSEVSIR